MSFAATTLGRATVRRAPAAGGLWARVRVWAELARQRRALARLEDARLRDLGLERDAAEAEAARPFWDAPRNWRA